MPRIKILIYIPEIDQRYGGIRQYSVNLLRTLGGLEPSRYEIVVYHLNSDPEIQRCVNDNKNIKLIGSDALKLPKGITLKNLLYKKIDQLSRLILGRGNPRLKPISKWDHLIKKLQIDVLHCPYQDMPDFTSKILKITTMHDVQEIHFPKYFTYQERRRRATMYPKYMRNSDVVIVSYEHIKNDLIDYFEIKSDKIVVCLLSMRHLWFNRFLKESPVENSHNIPEKFLLYPANAWEHKNHKILVEAIERIRDVHGEKVNIVFTGNFDSDYGASLKKLVADRKLNEQVFFLGIVDEETLYALYKMATGVVVPTLYEAGSFPLMESILMNIPVATSNVTSLPETIGDESFTFSPVDIEEVIEIVQKLYLDEDFREKSVRNSQLMQKRLIDTGAQTIIEGIYSKVRNVS